MTSFARERDVPAFECVSSLSVIEFSDWFVPMDQLKVRAVMLHVAPHAILAARIVHFQSSVIALFCIEKLQNFLVTGEAFERRESFPERMAVCAVGNTAERSVGTRKRSR